MEVRALKAAAGALETIDDVDSKPRSGLSPPAQVERLRRRALRLVAARNHPPFFGIGDHCKACEVVEDRRFEPME